MRVVKIEARHGLPGVRNDEGVPAVSLFISFNNFDEASEASHQLARQWSSEAFPRLPLILQGYLAHKKSPTRVGPPYDSPRTVGIGLQWGWVRLIVCEVHL